MGLTIAVDENMPGVEYFLGHMAHVQRLDGRSLTAAQLSSADALLVRSVTRVDRALLEGSSVRFVGTATSGIDHIDRQYLQDNNIGFAFAPGANANSVVEYVLCAIAAVDDFLEKLLSGGRLGIVGYGLVGSALSHRLDALGIDWCACDPWLEPSSVPRPASLAETLSCQVVSLHTELTHANPWPSFHLLGASELAAMSPDTLLINASRGAVVDNAALLALSRRRTGPITVLDVWEGEPLVDADLLQRVRLGTAHIAGYSLDGKYLATRMVGSAAAEFFAMKPLAAANPAGSPAAITLPSGLSQADAIRYLLRGRYDITRDDRLLRESVRVPSRAATAFDQLRRHYGERRELSGSAVLIQTKDQSSIAEALGCHVAGVV